MNWEKRDLRIAKTYMGSEICKNKEESRIQGWGLTGSWSKKNGSKAGVMRKGTGVLVCWALGMCKLYSTLATSCEELTHRKRLWCWEGLGAGGEGDDRGWDGWIASLTRWTWVWVNSGSWWWTGRPGMLRFMGHKESDTTEWLNWTNWTEAIQAEMSTKNWMHASETQGRFLDQRERLRCHQQAACKRKEGTGLLESWLLIMPQGQLVALEEQQVLPLPGDSLKIKWKNM